MAKTVWIAVCTALVGFATTAMTAQTTSAPQSNSSSSERQITVTGCLKEAPPDTAGATGTGTTATTGTTGTTGTATSATGTTGEPNPTDKKFLLTNASASPADPSGTSSTTGAPTPAAAATSDAQTYRLIANPVALAPHIGKKLELTGTLEDQAQASRTTEPSTGPNAGAPTLRVKAGKVLADSCSQ